jgi:hypothetical protein
MKNLPFLLVTPWSATTFKVLADDIGNTECSREQLRPILEAWIKKHLEPPTGQQSDAQKQWDADTQRMKDLAP